MALEQAGISLIAAGGDVYITTINNATKATDTFVNATEKGGGRVSSAGQVMIGALRQIGTIAVDVFAQAAKATAGFLKDSIGVAGDFEAGMNSFRAVAGADVDAKGIEQFRDLFLTLGKELPVSTAEVQKAAEEMIKGGISPAIVAAGGLRQNIQFAAAAMEGDLVKAAEISSKILGGWAGVNATAAEKTDFLAHATDLLTKAANASATDVEGLSLGIFNAQGIARTAGVSFDDLTTTLAALAPRFESSSVAGNSLKNMIARLQPTTQPATDAMTALGLYTEATGSAFYDAAGNFIGFEASAQILQDSLKGLTKEQQAATLQQIFGNDAMGAAAALAEIGATGYQNMADALANANGVAENAALKQQGFNTAMDNAKGSVEALQITIGSALMPILTDLINNVVAPGINALTELADAVFGNDEAFNRLSPTMQEVATAIQQFADDVQTGATQAMAFGTAIGDLIGWFSSAEGKSSELGSAINDLSAIWDKALVVVTNVGNGYLSIAQSILPIVTRFWDEHGTEISAFIKGAYDKIMSIVNVALDLYNAIVPKALGSVADWIDKHATGIQSVLSGAWKAISGIIDAALTLIEGTLKIALDIINGDWSKAWTDLQAMSVRITEDIGQVISGFFDIIAGLFNTSMADILQLWTDNWNMLVDIVTDTDWAQVGADVISGIVSGITDNAGKLYSALKNLASDALDAAKDALGISSPSTEFAAIGAFAVQGLLEGFSSTWPALSQLVGDLSDDLIDQMAGIGASINDVIADSFGATASIDRQMAKNLEQIGEIEDEFTQKVVTQDLEMLRKKAMDLFPDPKVAASYYKMVSNHEFETLALRKKIAEASTQEEKDRLNQQLILISRAQDAELDQFYTAQKGQASPAQAIIDAFNELMAKGLPINDTGVGHDLQVLIQLLTKIFNVPGVAGGGPVKAGMPVWVGEQGPELFWPQTNGMVSPAATSAQMASQGNQTNYNGQVGNTYNMPIYTNQSSQALQQSWAIMQASMP